MPSCQWGMPHTGWWRTDWSRRWGWGREHRWRRRRRGWRPDRADDGAAAGTPGCGVHGGGAAHRAVQDSPSAGGHVAYHGGPSGPGPGRRGHRRGGGQRADWAAVHLRPHLTEAAPARTTTMFRRGARAQQSPCTTVMCPQDVVERILGPGSPSLARSGCGTGLKCAAWMCGTRKCWFTPPTTTRCSHATWWAPTAPRVPSAGPAAICGAGRGLRCGGRIRRRQHAGAV
jgi:hypothetical protein